MDRKEFLSLLGMSAASLSVLSCLGGCTKNTDASSTAGPSGVDFTLDLSQSANTALSTPGGYLYKNGVIVARTKSGQYVAVQQVCTHESNSIVYQASGSGFYCDRHGATFAEIGAVTGGPAPRALPHTTPPLPATRCVFIHDSFYSRGKILKQTKKHEADHNSFIGIDS